MEERYRYGTVPIGEEKFEKINEQKRYGTLASEEEMFIAGSEPTFLFLYLPVSVPYLCYSPVRFLSVNSCFTCVMGSFMTSTSVTEPNCPKYSRSFSWSGAHLGPGFGQKINTKSLIVGAVGPYPEVNTRIPCCGSMAL